MKINSTNSNIIDIIRIFAAWLVLVGHTFDFAGKDTHIKLIIQSAGVVILFILAGFLTAYSLTKHNEANEYTCKEYYISRLLRLLPGLFIALIFILVVDSIHIFIDSNSYFYFEKFTWLNFIGDLFFLQNYPLIGDYIDPLGSGRPLWTLSLEFWQYLGIGSLYLIIKNQKKQNIFETIILCVCLIPVISNISTTSRGGGLPIAFFFGFLVFYLYRYLPTISSYIGLFACSILLIVFSFSHENPYSIWFFSLNCILLACVLNIGQNFEGKRIVFLSEVANYTYMLYLTHYTIVEIVCVNNIFGRNSVNIVLSLLISNVVAFVLYFIAEKPLRRVLEKIIAKKIRMCDKKK